jgi:hypothetical protein
MKGFIHMLRSVSQQTPDSNIYSAMFAPIGPTGTGAFIPAVDFRTVDNLIAFLKSAHIGEISIKAALLDLETKDSATIPNVDLSEHELRDLGLL